MTVLNTNGLRFILVCIFLRCGMPIKMQVEVRNHIFFTIFSFSIFCYCGINVFRKNKIIWNFVGECVVSYAMCNSWGYDSIAAKNIIKKRIIGHIVFASLIRGCMSYSHKSSYPTVKRKNSKKTLILCYKSTITNQRLNSVKSAFFAFGRPEEDSNLRPTV